MNVNKSWLVLAFVATLMIIVVVVTIATPEKEENKNQSTNKFGTVVRGFAGFLLFTVVGAAAMQLSKGRAVQQRRKKKIQDGGSKLWKPVFLESKKFARNDLLVLAAGVYWSTKYPKAFQVYDLDKYPSMQKIYDELKSKSKFVDTLPTTLERKTFRTYEKFQNTLYNQLGVPISINLYDANFNLIDTNGILKSCREDATCIRLLLKDDKVGLLIRTRKGDSVQESQDRSQIVSIRGQDIVKTAAGYQIWTSQIEAEDYRMISEGEKRMLMFLNDISEDIITDMNKIYGYVQRKQFSTAKDFVEGLIVKKFKQENPDLDTSVVLSSSASPTDMDTLVDAMESYKSRGPRKDKSNNNILKLQRMLATTRRL